ncbi:MULTISPECIES: ABC transporter permease [Deefgea]|uniref:Transport permease protein n=1 Tax=Deefgea chitinilytica TaxID=570276 RepID=A0ABS2C786_9NEIS|nr:MULTISPECIES: ABC transporter permease [Deefgea]MBM5570014.1 ABC transporter permease [Deefgea chitinilytica]MBM9887243.1 ABC transporter permease [Deefgea sp. CFH1-16]
MQSFTCAPVEIFNSFWRNRSLIKALVQREVIGRYRGSALGILWSFFNPIFMLVVYTFVFSVVFKARWSGGSESRTEFALVLFAGLIVFNLFAECVSRAPGLILGNINYVKKVVFPLEILPWVSIGSALFHLSISVFVWLIFYMIEVGLPHPTIFLLPIVLLPILILIMGLSWMLASLGVYLRDVGQIVGILITVLMFLSPIFFPIDALPLNYQKFMLMNPLSPAIEQIRDILYWGKMFDLKMYVVYLLSSSMIAWLGFAWFQKSRKGFADVL